MKDDRLEWLSGFGVPLAQKLAEELAMSQEASGHG
jgi:hypothetical protein